MYYLAIPKSFNPEFSSVGRFTASAEHIHPKRRLDSTVLLVGYSGTCPIAQDGREYALSKGCAMLLFSGHTHYGTGKSFGEQSHFWCHFYLPQGFRVVCDDDIDALEDDCFVIPEFINVCDFEKLFVLFPQLTDAAEAEYKREELRLAICSSYVKILLTELSEAFLKSKSDKKGGGMNAVISAKATEWIRRNCSAGINAGAVAEAVGYNPDYLSAVLKKETGLTLNEQICKARIADAKKLLLNSGMKISEIAYAVGFGDEKYFMKVFKRTVGITAREYRCAHFREHGN